MGYLSASATINGEAFDSLHIDCKKAGRDAIEIVPRVLIFLSEVSDVEARRCITQACLRTLELRLHFLIFVVHNEANEDSPNTDHTGADSSREDD